VAERRRAEEGREEALAWVDSKLARAPLARHSFRDATSRYLRAVIEDRNEPARRLAAWLRGEALPASEAKAEGLYELLHGSGSPERRFTNWVEAVGGLPRRQTRVLTWPMVTVWGFLAQPRTHIFLKPTVTRAAAAKYGFDFAYKSKPSWETYSSLLAFAERVRADNRDLRPRDMIDAQSFMWVQGSDEYPG
jgi:hypothetical protein